MTTTSTPVPPAPAPPAEKTVTVTIDGKSITVPQGTTMWEAARTVGINIPALCQKEDLRPVGVCRACVVEVTDGGNGRPEATFAPSCARECADKMVIKTSSERVERA